MKLITRQKLVATTTQEYTPELAELYFWYSGTNAGLDPKNPYSRKRSSVTRTIYKAVQ